MNVFLRVLLSVYFGDSSWYQIVIRILYMAGVWRILKKSGLKGWWALVPWAREYMIARCAHREPEGRNYCVISFVLDMSDILMLILTNGSIKVEDLSSLVVTILIIRLSLELVRWVFALRVFSGLIQVYGLRKRWLWLCWTEFLSWIPVLIWGFVNKYQPRWKVEDLREEMERLAAHGSAGILDQGLTVNLKDRTVTEFFQKKVLLRDIHLSIPQGHMVLLLGGSGAGKTTFINAVNGYEKANAEVMLNGANMYTQYKHMQYEVGFVPQTEMMQGKDTVWNTLMDSARLRLPMDVDSEQRKKRVEEVMEIFGLLPVRNNLVEKLSGGQKKRLSISMEFLSNPSLFILDEPDSGLDGVMARELFEQLRKIADTGKIAIVITHTPDRVIDLFDDVIVLAKDSARTGRLAWYGSIEDAKKFFQSDSMEKIVKRVNRKEEGGDGLADEYVMKYAEVQYG